MANQVTQYEFKGSGIKTPFEKMRANAIINAKLDTVGMSLINFNITAFLGRSRHEDAFLILSLWAIKPIRDNLNAFQSNPHQGEEALNKRISVLIERFQTRPDMTPAFLDAATIRMNTAVESEIMHLKSASRQA